MFNNADSADADQVVICKVVTAIVVVVRRYYDFSVILDSALPAVAIKKYAYWQSGQTPQYVTSASSIW